MVANLRYGPCPCCSGTLYADPETGILECDTCGTAKPQEVREDPSQDFCE